MNEKMWEDALSGIDQKYIDRAVRNFRAGSGRTNVIEARFIDPPAGGAPAKKSRAARIFAAAASAAAAVALIFGGLLVTDRINKALGRPPEDKVDVLLAEGTGTSEFTTPQPEQEFQYILRSFTDETHAKMCDAFSYTEVAVEDIREYRRNFVPDTEFRGGGSDGTNFYFMDIGGYPLTVSMTAPGGSEKYYVINSDAASDVISGLEDGSFTVRFFVTENGPVELVKHTDSDSGATDIFVIQFDSSMQMTNLSKLDLPDDFFGIGTAEVTFDGKYIIDTHWSVYMDSSPYIRVYEVGDLTFEPSRLAYEFDKQLSSAAFEFNIINITASAISKDGSTLILTADVDIASSETFEMKKGAACMRISLDTGIMYSATTREGEDFTYLPYDGGIAVIGDGNVLLCTSDGYTAYTIEDWDSDEGYAVSPNGKYIRTLKTDVGENQQYYQYTMRGYCVDKAEEKDGEMWLMQKDCRTEEWYHEEPIERDIFLASNNRGDMIAMCKGNTSLSSDMPSNGVWDDPDGGFMTVTDRTEDSSGIGTDSVTSAPSDRGRKFVFPVSDSTAQITANFGYDEQTGTDHSGIDITSAHGTGTPLIAASDGTVELVVNEYGASDDYGRYLIISHDDCKTLYAHCDEIYVKQGETVNKGQIIASMGSTGLSTGPHLFFEVIEDGVSADPLQYVSLTPFLLHCRPVQNGAITGHTEEDGGYEGHKGVDIDADSGENIRAFADGTVIFSGFDDSGYGKYIIIDHNNGYKTLYAHCSILHVSEGDEVKTGDVIAAVGSSGFTDVPRLHFEIIKGDENIDPMIYLDE